MIREEKTAREFVIQRKFCDECGLEIKRDMACSVARCKICRKDLCDKCVGHEVDTMGDYREVYCEKCWTIGDTYRNKIKDLEDQIDNLNAEWIQICR